MVYFENAFTVVQYQYIKLITFLFGFQGGHDLHTTYAENLNRNTNIATETISSDSSTESDSDEIFVLGEVRAADRTRPSSAANLNQPTVEQIPSTSRGVAKLPVTSSHLVISSDDETAEKKVDENGDVEVVGYVKPRHLRTPVIVSLSSEDEDQPRTVKKEVLNTDNVTIDISDSEEDANSIPESAVVPVTAHRWSTSSDEEALGKKREKGKGKGKNSRNKHSVVPKSSDPSCSTSETAAMSSPNLVAPGTSSAATSSPAAAAAEERSRIISPMGLISTWMSRRTTRSR